MNQPFPRKKSEPVSVRRGGRRVAGGDSVDQRDAGRVRDFCHSPVTRAGAPRLLLELAIARPGIGSLVCLGSLGVRLGRP